MSGLDPAEVVIIAAEPGVIEIGLELSPALREARAQMASAALAVAHLWQGQANASSTIATVLQSRA